MDLFQSLRMEVTWCQTLVQTLQRFSIFSLRKSSHEHEDEAPDLLLLEFFMNCTFTL